MSRKCKNPHCTKNRKDDMRESYVSENKKKPSRKNICVVNNSHNPSRHRKIRKNYNEEFNCRPVNKGPCPFESSSPQNNRKRPSTGPHRVRCSKKSRNHNPQFNNSSNTLKYLTQEKENDSRIWKTRNKNIYCSCVNRLQMKRKCVCGLMGKGLENKVPCKCGKTIKKLKENYLLYPSFSFHVHCQCHCRYDKYSDKVKKDHSCVSNKSTTSTFHKLCSCFRRKSNSTLSQLSSRKCLCRDSTVELFGSCKSSEFLNTQNPHETSKKNVLHPFENIQKIEGCECFQEKDMPNRYKQSCKCIRKKTKTCIKPSAENTKITKCKKTKRNKRSRSSSSEYRRSIHEKSSCSKRSTQSSQSNNRNKSSSSLTLKDNQASCFEGQQRIHRPEKLSSQIIVSTEKTVRRDEKKRKNKGCKVQRSKYTLMGIMFDIIFWPYAFWPGQRNHS